MDLQSRKQLLMIDCHSKLLLLHLSYACMCFKRISDRKLNRQILLINEISRFSSFDHAACAMVCLLRACGLRCWLRCRSRAHGIRIWSHVRLHAGCWTRARRAHEHVHAEHMSNRWMTSVTKMRRGLTGPESMRDKHGWRACVCRCTCVRTCQLTWAIFPRHWWN